MNTEKKLFIADLKHNQAKRSLSSVTDTFSNTITIERDQAQVPTAIISPEGLKTELTIDDNNHLTRVTFPDGSHMILNTAPTGSWKHQTDPKGNQFFHSFSDTGKLQEVLDEGGRALDLWPGSV